LMNEDMRKRNRNLFILIVLIGLLVLANKTVLPILRVGTTEVTIITDQWVGFIPVTVADKMGYFADYGISPKITYREDLKPNTNEELLDFDVSLSTVGSFITETPRDWELVAPIDVSNGADAIVVKSDEYLNPKSWVGKRIISYGGSDTLHLLYKFLETNNLSLEDVTVDAIMPNVNNKLEYFTDNSSGVVAIATWEPNITTILDRFPKSSKVVDSAAYYGLITEIIQFRQRVDIKTRLAVVRAIYDAIDLKDDDPYLFYEIADKNSSLSSEQIVDTMRKIRSVGYDQYSVFMGSNDIRKDGILREYYSIIEKTENKLGDNGDVDASYDERVKPLDRNLKGI
jgi:hypothetical protein